MYVESRVMRLIYYTTVTVTVTKVAIECMPKKGEKKNSYAYYTRVSVCNVYTVLCIHKFRDNASL